MILSLSRKTTSEFFQLSARARVLCCKNGVVLHKTYLAICPMQISLSMKDENVSLKKGENRIEASGKKGTVELTDQCKWVLLDKKK